MNHKLLTLLFAVLLSFISCNRDEEAIIEKLNPASVDVYVAGTENGKACYWKNGVIKNLQNGDGLTPKKIIVDNNNVYVFANNILWKNNIKLILKNYLNIPLTSIVSFADFTVKNNTELFAGFVDNTGVGNLNSFDMCYWKNGTKTILENNRSFNSLNIDFFNNEVYFSNTSNYPNSGYYRNNIFHSLSGEWMQNFAQNNSGVHYLYINNSNKDLVCYNTNSNGNTFTNTTTSYPNLGSSNLISDIVTNDLYTFSNEISGFYFKNNTVINLTDPNYRKIEDMKSMENNLYMIRSFATISGPSIQISLQYKVFINNVETQYINGTNGSFKSIFVVQN